MVYRVEVPFSGFEKGTYVNVGDSELEQGFLANYGQYLVEVKPRGAREDRDSQGEGAPVRAEEGSGAGVLDGRGDSEAGQGEDPDPAL
jgi:hypothetical protein